MQIYNCVSNTLHSNHCQTSLTCLQRTRATIPRSDSQQQWPWLASICRGFAAVCRVTTILICPRLNCRILHQLPHLAEGLHLEERGFAVRAALPEDGRVGPRQPAHHQPHLRRREVLNTLPLHCRIIVAISHISCSLFAEFCLPAGGLNPLSKCLSVFSFNFVGCHFDFSKIRILESFSLHFPTLNQCWECW